MAVYPLFRRTCYHCGRTLRPKHTPLYASHLNVAETASVVYLDWNIDYIRGVAYGILPLFALANAGLSFTGMQWKTFFHPLPLGYYCAGLFFGKQCGIFAASWIAVKAKWTTLPDKINWQQLYGSALICGIGFTMSLFLANLAFPDNQFFFTDTPRCFKPAQHCREFLGYCVLFF